MNCNAKKSQKKDQSFLEFGYFRARRQQVLGKPTMLLKTSFTYLQPWTGERFAPDEPSSFSYINYKFADRNQYLDYTIGLFRNHSKGDIIIDNHNLHFEKGNAQVGIMGGIKFQKTVYKKFGIITALYLGFGPQLSLFSGNNIIVLPETWGIKGVGTITNLSCGIISPIIKKRIQLVLQINMLYHHVRFNNFSIIENNNAFIYKNICYGALNINPNLQINYLLKK